jgi:hypothetical protein
MIELVTGSSWCSKYSSKITLTEQKWDNTETSAGRVRKLAN